MPFCFSVKFYITCAGEADIPPTAILSPPPRPLTWIISLHHSSTDFLNCMIDILLFLSKFPIRTENLKSPLPAHLLLLLPIATHLVSQLPSQLYWLCIQHCRHPSVSQKISHYKGRNRWYLRHNSSTLHPYLTNCNRAQSVMFSSCNQYKRGFPAHRKMFYHIWPCDSLLPWAQGPFPPFIL